MQARHKLLIFLAFFLYVLEKYLLSNTSFSFICKDPKLSHPFKGDTVSFKNLLITGNVGPILIITLTEFFQNRSFKSISFRNVWKYYKEFLTGCFLTLLVTEVIKTIVREPRPHFLYSCQPDSDENCQAGTLISEYTCTNNKLGAIYKADLTRSFPSGHSSGSIYVVVFCAYIIHNRIPSKAVSSFTKPVLIGLCLIWGLWCSLSRITDRRHHWWDVLGGAILGIAGACHTVNLLNSKEEKRNIKVDC